jgi:hypothetical protein
MSPKSSLNCVGEKVKFGEPVRTACGGVVQYSGNTPCVLFRGEAVYFCLPVCKEDFERDPLSSCLAARILSGK